MLEPLRVDVLQEIDELLANELLEETSSCASLLGQETARAVEAWVTSPGRSPTTPPRTDGTHSHSNSETASEGVRCRIFLRLALTGELLAEVRMRPDETAGELRQAVRSAVLARTPRGRPELVFEGEKLTDCMTLEAAGIGRDAEVQVVIARPLVVVTASKDWTAKLWDADTGQLCKVFWGHAGAVTSVCFAPHGFLLATAAEDGTAKLWDAKTGACQRTLRDNDTIITSICFAPDGQTVATASGEGLLKLWEASSGRCLRSIRGHGFAAKSVCFAPDGSVLASASMDRTVKIWEAVSGKCVGILKHASDVASVCFAPQGLSCATASIDGTVRLWDLRLWDAVGECKQMLKGWPPVCFAPNGHIVATAALDHTAKLWDVCTGQIVRTLTGHLGHVTSVSFGPGGHTAVYPCKLLPQ